MSNKRTSMVSRKAGSGCGVHPSPAYTLEPSLFRGIDVPGTFSMECHPQLTQGPRKEGQGENSRKFTLLSSLMDNQQLQ